MSLALRPPRQSSLGLSFVEDFRRGYAGVAKNGGTITGTVPIEPGGWLVFNNNIANHITYPPLRLQGVTAFSAWAYVKELSAIAAFQTIFGIQNEFILFTTDNWTNARFDILVSGVDRAVVGVLPVVASGNARLLVGTWTSGDYLRLYHNGVQLGVSSSTYAGSIIETPTPSLLVGVINGPSWPLTGKVRDFGTVNRQFSQAEVLAMYNNNLLR